MNATKKQSTHKCLTCGQKFTSLESATRHIAKRHPQGAVWAEGNITMWEGQSADAKYTVICETHQRVTDDNSKSRLKDMMTCPEIFCDACESPERWCVACDDIIPFWETSLAEHIAKSVEVHERIAKSVALAEAWIAKVGA